MSCVHVLLETWNLAVSRCGRATTAKNNAKKRDARAKFVFAFLNVLSFVFLVVVVLVVTAKSFFFIGLATLVGSCSPYFNTEKSTWGQTFFKLRKFIWWNWLSAFIKERWLVILYRCKSVNEQLTEEGQYSGVSKNTLEPTNNINSVKVNSKVTTIAAPTVRRRLLLKEWYWLSKARFKRRAIAVPS